MSNGVDEYRFDMELTGVIFSHSPATALTRAMGVGRMGFGACRILLSRWGRSGEFAPLRAIVP